MGLGFRVQGLRVLGSVLWVLGFRFWVLGFGSWVLGFGFWILGFGFWVVGFGFWVLSGRRVCGPSPPCGGWVTTKPANPRTLKL